MRPVPLLTSDYDTAGMGVNHGLSVLNRKRGAGFKSAERWVEESGGDPIRAFAGALRGLARRHKLTVTTPSNSARADATALLAQALRSTRASGETRT